MNSLKIFIDIFNRSYNEHNSSKEIFKFVLFHYIKLKSEQDIKEMCEDIVQKYFENIEIKKKDQILKVIYIKEKINKINKLKAFYRWKNMKNNDTNINVKTRNNNINNSFNNKLNNDQTGSKKYESYSLKRELEELKQCTFKPDIKKKENNNNKFKYTANNSLRTNDIHSKLYEVYIFNLL
jgi:hypothetical protein